MADLQKSAEAMGCKNYGGEKNFLFWADVGKECLFPAQKSNYILQQSFDSPAHGRETIQLIRQGLRRPNHYTDK